MNTNSNEYTAVPSGEHTPTPWHSGYGYIWGAKMEMIGDVDDEEAYVLRMRGVGGNLPIEANQAFIVQACNSHYALVAALQKIFNDFERTCLCECDQDDCCFKVNETCAKCEARAALALAKPLVSKETK